MSKNNDETNSTKKPYEKPAITHVEKLEGER
jgi:hypothetical protein